MVHKLKIDVKEHIQFLLNGNFISKLEFICLSKALAKQKKWVSISALNIEVIRVIEEYYRDRVVVINTLIKGVLNM